MLFIALKLKCIILLIVILQFSMSYKAYYQIFKKYSKIIIKT